MLELSKEEAMGDFRRTAFRRKPRSGGSGDQPEEETDLYIFGNLDYQICNANITWYDNKLRIVHPGLRYSSPSSTT
ncbi:FYVE, RhoGEF and PH domain-containing protein 4a isoform X6 [Tachysurus ichikawai]